MQNNVIGGLKMYQASPRTSSGNYTDMAYKANINNNKPIYINTRPTDNFLTISISSIIDGDTNLIFNLPYLMDLFFQEI